MLARFDRDAGEDVRISTVFVDIGGAARTKKSQSQWAIGSAGLDLG